MNPFEILGLSRTSSREDITSAFRRLAKDCHPDTHPDDAAAAERFDQYKQAYEAAKRLAGTTFTPSNPSARPERRDGHKDVAISIEQAVAGTVVRISNASGPCRACSGEGHINTPHVHRCDTCNGSGVSGYKERGIITVKVGCPDCGGSGRTSRIKCSECSGYGSLPRRELEVQLPAGCNEGDVLTVAGGMNNSDTLTVGDLYLHVRLKKSDVYRVVGNDIETDLRLQVWDAALGCIRSVESPDGRKFNLTIPSGTQNGKKFRMKDAGLHGEGGVGAFVVVAVVVIPDASSGVTKAAFESLKQALAKA